MLIGYARTSTVEQEAGLEAQLRDLSAAGCEEIYSEQVSSIEANRPELEAAIRFARKGDTLVVTKLDRLARSLPDARAIADELTARRISLSLGGSVYDPTDAVGKLNRPGVSGDSKPWEGWSHVREHTQAVSG